MPTQHPPKPPVVYVGEDLAEFLRNEPPTPLPRLQPYPVKPPRPVEALKLLLGLFYMLDMLHLLITPLPSATGFARFTDGLHRVFNVFLLIPAFLFQAHIITLIATLRLPRWLNLTINLLLYAAYLHWTQQDHLP